MFHELKILPEYYRAVNDGCKKFEIRKDDRNFTKGDELCLKEISENGEYTGSPDIRCKVTYVLRDAEKYGLKDGFCILGITRTDIEKSERQMIDSYLNMKFTEAELKGDQELAARISRAIIAFRKDDI